MNEDFVKRVRTAAIAGWWTLLIAAIFLTIQWPIYLWTMHAKPACMLSYWGAGATWPMIQTVWLWSIAIFKLSVWIMAAVVVWLTLWARGLKRG